jgi:hypothetical protein
MKSLSEFRQEQNESFNPLGFAGSLMLNPLKLLKFVTAAALSPAAGAIAGTGHYLKNLAKGKHRPGEIPKGIGRWMLGWPTKWQVTPDSLQPEHFHENIHIANLPDDLKEPARRMLHAINDYIKAVQSLSPEEKSQLMQ